MGADGGAGGGGGHADRSASGPAAFPPADKSHIYFNKIQNSRSGSYFLPSANSYDS